MKYSAMLWRCKFLSVMTALMWARVGGSTFATGGGKAEFCISFMRCFPTGIFRRFFYDWENDWDGH